MKIPTLKLNTVIKNSDMGIANCFYAIEKETDKQAAIELIRNEMKDYLSFGIYYDCKVNTKIGQREWSFDGNVMIFENKNCTNENRLVVDGKGSYECVLWMFAKNNIDAIKDQLPEYTRFPENEFIIKGDMNELS